MDTTLELDIFNESFDIWDQEFKEFYNNTKQLDRVVDQEFYIEAMVDNNKSFVSKMMPKKPLENTVKTTKDIKKAYTNVTDGGATFIQSVWNLTMKSIQLVSKILRYILINMSRIPKAIIKTFQTISRIPSDVRNVIKGNITLYITVNDINDLHNKLIPMIDDFLFAAEDMSKGKMWGTFFNRRPIGDGTITKYVLTENDIGYFKKMRSIYNKLKLINFDQTLIKLENQSIVDIYFGEAKSIKYKNSDGKNIESNYYDALVAIFDIFKEQNDFLKNLEQDMGVKMNKTQMNQSFAKLGESAQKTISETMTMLYKIINIMANLIKYVMIDIKTINNSANKILSRNKVSTVKS